MKQKLMKAAEQRARVQAATMASAVLELQLRQLVREILAITDGYRNVEGLNGKLMEFQQLSRYAPPETVIRVLDLIALSDENMN